MPALWWTNSGRPPRMRFRVKTLSVALVASFCVGGLLLFADSWQPGAGVRSAALRVPSTGKPGFVQLSPTVAGIFFTNHLAAGRYLTNQIYLNGSGVAAGDVDGDGLVDLYFCGLDNDNVLYRNLGHWKFEDITAKAGVACPGLDATGAAFADIDGDGDLDLIVNTIGGGTRVFLNDGKAGVKETSAGLNAGKGAMSLDLADIA